MAEKLTIAIVLEGNEEKCLFDIAQKCGGINNAFDVIIVNASGYGNLGAYFQEFYSDPAFDCVVAVYDVDGKPRDKYSPFSIVQNDLLSILGEIDLVNLVSFCTNPSVLQMLLLGCDELSKVSLVTSSKKANSEIVSKYWPKISTKIQKNKKIKNGYDASKWQLDIIQNSFVYNEEAVTQSCPTLCDPMNHSTPGLPVHHQLTVYPNSCPSSQ